MYSIDLNSDLGESFGAYKMGRDADIIPLVSSANVACGFHAGDPTIMAKTAKLCKESGNDLNTKIKAAQKFLTDGNRVKVSVRFRGREMAHTNLGEKLLMDLLTAVLRSPTWRRIPSWKAASWRCS